MTESFSHLPLDKWIEFVFLDYKRCEIMVERQVGGYEKKFNEKTEK